MAAFDKVLADVLDPADLQKLRSYVNGLPPERRAAVSDAIVKAYQDSPEYKHLLMGSSGTVVQQVMKAARAQNWQMMSSTEQGQSQSGKPPSPLDAPRPQSTKGYLQAGQSTTDLTKPAAAGDPSKPQPQVPSLQTDLPADNNAYLAGYLGIDQAQLQKQYQSYVSVVNQTIARLPVGGKDINVRPLPMQEWVDSQVNNLEGAYKPILDYYSQAWSVNHGTRIPPDLMVSLRNAVRSANPAAKAAMDQAIIDWQKALTTLQAGGSTAIVQQGLSNLQSQALGYINAPSAALPSMPFLENIVTQYENSPIGTHGLDAARLKLEQTFMQALHRMPTASELDQYANADSITMNAYMNTQNVVGTSLTYGQYGSAADRANTYWKKYFNKAPSQQDINFVAGFQDEQQLQDWVYAQPSHLKGTNIGDYTALHDAGDKVSRDLWNTPGTSGLTGALASAMGTSK